MSITSLYKTKKEFLKQSHSGQILVEVMLAISISVISLIGFFGLLQTSFKLSRITSENYIASHLAVEGVEIVANIIQRNYVEMEGNMRAAYAFNTDIESGDFEIDTNVFKIDSTLYATNPLSHPITLNGLTFYRRVSIASNGSSIHVISSVYSSNFGTSQSLASVEDTFLNWWQQPPPAL